jgi:hypothetical protein
MTGAPAMSDATMIGIAKVRMVRSFFAVLFGIEAEPSVERWCTAVVYVIIRWISDGDSVRVDRSRRVFPAIFPGDRIRQHVSNADRTIDRFHFDAILPECSIGG